MSYTKAISYSAAHKWEPLARQKGVSKVARSSGGFMRAYQRAGSFARLPERWKKKREAFIKRHMAQGKNEQLWKGGQPSRRALALLMWAYMPPGRRSNPGKKVTVYHHTSPQKAAQIHKTKRLKSSGEPHVYVTTWPHPDTGYGSAVVALRVPEHQLELDDEFPSGRQDFRIAVGKPGGSLPVEVVKVNPQPLFRVILAHPYEPTYYEFHQPTPRSRIHRTKYEGDGFSTSKHKLKTVSWQGALAEIQRKIKGGWIQQRGNPGEVIRPGTGYFRKAGETKRQLKLAQEDIYRKTGKWLTEKELLQFMHEHNIRARRAQIRRVK